MSDDYFELNPKVWMSAQDGAGQWWSFENGPAVFHVPTSRWIAQGKAQATPLGLQKKTLNPQGTAVYNPAHEEACKAAQERWAQDVRAKLLGTPQGGRGVVMSGEGIGGFGGDGQ